VAASYPPPGSPYPFGPLDFERLDEREMARRARCFYERMDRRRSVREFSPDPVPRELIDLAITTASTAPSGANQQPWTWVVIGDAETKRVVREAVEREERENYEGGRMPAEWQQALEPLGTTSDKPYLEVVPWIVVVFEQAFGIDANGRRRKHYYPKQSVGIACGLFIAALHTMGLATLTHTPGPMEFLRRLLDRPRNERAFMLFPVGYPSEPSLVPDLQRKSLAEVTAEPPPVDRPCHQRRWTTAPSSAMSTSPENTAAAAARERFRSLPGQKWVSMSRSAPAAAAASPASREVRFIGGPGAPGGELACCQRSVASTM
jgi:iodotyrosine deiodinase